MISGKEFINIMTLLNISSIHVYLVTSASFVAYKSHEQCVDESEYPQVPSFSIYI